MIPRSAREAVIVVSVIVMTFAVTMTVHARQAGQLAGTVYDETGAALAGASITLRGAVSREGRSDAAGRFQFRDLPAGEYDLSAALEGFETARRTIRIPPGERLSISLGMVVAGFRETVVSAAKVGERDIQSTPMAISAVSDADVTRRAIRTIDQVAPLVPSVTFTQNGTFGQLSIRGIGTNAVNAGSDPSSAV